MKKEYSKPEVLKYDNLKKITEGFGAS